MCIYIYVCMCVYIYIYITLLFEVLLKVKVLIDNPTE